MNLKEPETEPKQLLFIHQGAFGDQLLSLPLLDKLAHSYDLTYLGRGLGFDLIRSFLPIKALQLDQTPSQLHAQLKFIPYELCISVGPLDWLDLSFKQTHTLSTHGRHESPIWISWHQQVLQQIPKPYYTNKKIPLQPKLILAPGSGSTKKNWPLQHYTSLSQSIVEHIKIDVLMGPAEIERGLPKQWKDLDGQGQLTITENSNEIVDLYQNATHFVGNDSGPAHLASVFNLKGCVCFISSNANLWAPYGEHLTSLNNPSYRDVLNHMETLL